MKIKIFGNTSASSNYPVVHSAHKKMIFLSV